jgi:transposase
MAGRIISRKFKIEAVRLVEERGIRIAQASRDLDLNDIILRRWIREISSDPSQAFLARGQIKADELRVEKLRREVVRLRAERTFYKKPQPTLRRK